MSLSLYSITPWKSHLFWLSPVSLQGHCFLTIPPKWFFLGLLVSSILQNLISHSVLILPDLTAAFVTVDHSFFFRSTFFTYTWLSGTQTHLIFLLVATGAILSERTLDHGISLSKTLQVLPISSEYGGHTWFRGLHMICPLSLTSLISPPFPFVFSISASWAFHCSLNI